MDARAWTRSSACAMAATPSAVTASPAASHTGATYAHPAAMTLPPSHGPSVLPTLNADVLTEAAMVGASPATTNTRALIAGASEATPLAPTECIELLSLELLG